jgi:hypothetical protein
MEVIIISFATPSDLEIKFTIVIHHAYSTIVNPGPDIWIKLPVIQSELSCQFASPRSLLLCGGGIAL